MKIFLRIIAGLLILLVVLVIAVLGFLYTFNANDYKQELTDYAETLTGRPISIAGNIDISLYPLLGIKVDSVTINNPPGFSKDTFATIGQFDIKIEIIPLLQNRLNIEELVLKHLIVNFEKNANDKNNWSDLAGESKDHGLAGLVINTIEVSDASLAWLDVNTGKQFKISRMKLATEAVVKGQPLPITFNAYVNSHQPDWRGSVFVKTKLEFNNNSPVFNANELKLVVKALLPSSKLEKITIAMIADGEVNVQAKTAKLSKAKLSVLGLKMAGDLDVENIFSVPVIHGPLSVATFSADELAQRFDITIPPLANVQSLKNISLKTSFKTDFDSIYLDAIVAKVDESKVQGFIHINNMQQPVLSYDLKVDKIHLDDYMADDNGSDQADMQLPLDLIRSSELEGSVKIDVVTMGDIELEKLHITSSVKDGLLKIAPATMLVGEGEVLATIELNATEPALADFTVTATKVNAESSINPLLKTILGDKTVSLEGLLTANASLKASGTNMAELKRSAAGKVTVNMNKPLIQGIDLDHTTRFNVAEYANKNNFRTSKSFVTEHQTDRKTEFDTLNATFKLAHGKLVNNDLLLVSEKANITGSGSIDFINKKLVYRPVIDMNVGDAVDIRDRLRDHPMEYNTSGSFNKISITFDSDKYERLVARLLLQESRARSFKQKKGGSWQNFKSE